MCLPFLAPIGAALGASAGSAAAVGTAATISVIGTGISAYSAINAGERQKEAADYNAEVGRQRAGDALQRGADEAATKRDEARKVGAMQREGLSMSGVDVNTGTPLDLLTETAGLGELAALKTLNNARREAWGYRAQADLDEFQGRNARTTGYLNGAGTILGGAANTYYGAKASMRAAA